MFKITLLAMLASAVDSCAQTPPAGARPAEIDPERPAPTPIANRREGAASPLHAAPCASIHHPDQVRGRREAHALDGDDRSPR